MASLLLLLLLNSKKCNETHSRYKITDDDRSLRTQGIPEPVRWLRRITDRLFIVATIKMPHTQGKRNNADAKKTVENERMKKNSTNIFFQLFCSQSQSIFMMIQNFNSLSIPLFLLAIALRDKKLPSYGRSRSFRWEKFFIPILFFL